MIGALLPCREGHHPDADDAGEEEEVNVIAELRPFLPHEPPMTESTLSTAAEAPDKEVGECAQSEVQDTLAEEQAVRAYLTANGRAASLQLAGIALLYAMVQHNRGCWRKDTAKHTLALASALGSSWRPDGNSSFSRK